MKPLLLSETMAKAAFCRNFRAISRKFHFYVCFLAAKTLSGVFLYADENVFATSASKFGSPYI